MRKPHLPFGLNRPKIRQSWNKYNMYNISRAVGRESAVKGMNTFFQQKWAAKSKMRGYHGEHIPEIQWKRLFSRRLMGAVDMPPKYLARHDGSEQAEGRGSGLTTSNLTAESFSEMPKLETESPYQKTFFGDVNELLMKKLPEMTPYMQMTFAPLERRLDTAIFRALFASSVRQARQFIIHGSVKVNGHKMIHPSYLLNPGDMFQVDIEKVMFATGHPKKSRRDMQLRGVLESRKEAAEKLSQGSTSQAIETETATEQSADEGAEDASAKAEASEPIEGEGSEKLESSSSEPPSAEEAWKTNEKALKFILARVRKILRNDPRDLTAVDKKRLRVFRDDARRFLARPDDAEVDAQELMEELQLQMKSHEMMRETFEKLELKEDASASEPSEQEPATQAAQEPEHNRQRQLDKGLEGLTEEQKDKAVRIMGNSQLSRDEMRKLAKLLQADEENPVDDTKTYATPWRPRAFMPAFAFIPRYLEVNPKICSAVYLRHPVARKGMAEVPTPFNYLTSQLTHNWYLERG